MRLEALFRAADQLRTDSALHAKLAESTGLSPQGITYALEHQLERTPPESELNEFFAKANSTPSVHVILSSTVFTGALRAIAWALAKSASVTVSPSRREPHFAEALIAQLADSAVTLSPQRDVSTLTSGEVHLYGSDDSMRSIDSQLQPGVRLEAHGSGLGIALVTTDFQASAERIARDVVPFDQRGCLSPRVVFVIGDAADFAKRLSAQLDQWGTQVPRGALPEQRAITAHVQTMQYAGHVYSTYHGSVSVSDAVVIPPTGRNVHVVPVTSPDQLAQRMGSWLPLVTTLGSDTHVEGFPTRVPLGQMQTPPFTGPVDKRVLHTR